MSFSKFNDTNIQDRITLREQYHECDTELEINGFKIECHRRVLEDQSDFFKACFLSNFKESKPNSSLNIGISIDATVLHSIADYFYTQEITLDKQNCFQCLVFAHTYLVDKLLQVAQQWIVENIGLCQQPMEVINSIHMYLTQEQLA